MIRPMTDRTIEMVAVQYEEYIREMTRRRPVYEEEPQPSLRRRTSRGLRRVADAVDPGEL